MGAYGPCLDAAGPAPHGVDAAALAHAFGELAYPNGRRPDSGSLATAVLREFGVERGLLDLGCGAGDLLIELARNDDRFGGIGVDSNPEMCTREVERADAAGVLPRLRIYHGDAFDVLSSLPADAIDGIEAVHAASFFNALFANGHERAVEVLTLLGRRVGRRLLFVDDYYGQLGATFDADSGVTWSVMQDLVQVCSGQGVPPREREDWEAIYGRAGCRLVRAYEGELGGFLRFVHVVQLAADS